MFRSGSQAFVRRVRAVGSRWKTIWSRVSLKAVASSKLVYEVCSRKSWFGGSEGIMSRVQRAGSTPLGVAGALKTVCLRICVVCVVVWKWWKASSL